jgi:uroporphyrinogen-III synthase
MGTHAAKLLAFERPLTGASVVITRPASTADAIRGRVQALGGKPVSLPGIGLRAVVDAGQARRELRAARAADIVIFISPAAVRFAWNLLPGLRFVRSTCVLAPGVGSTRALRRHGVAALAPPPDRQDSEGLLDLPCLSRVRRRHVVLVGAAGGRDLLSRELRARGARVRLIEVYQRIAPHLNRRHFAQLERATGPLIGLFSSAEALINLHARLPPALFAHLAANDCVVSSARVAEVAHTLGFAHVHVATSALPAALLAAACAALARHRI